MNKACEELESITGEIVLEGLGGPDCLPAEDHHCIWLAANALHAAVGDYHQRIADCTK